MSNSNDSFQAVFQSCFDEAIQKTFGRQHRHDFWSALAEVLQNKLIPQVCNCNSTDVRWIKCKRFRNVVIFGFSSNDFEDLESKKSLLNETEEFTLDVFGYKFQYEIFFEKELYKNLSQQEEIEAFFAFVADKFNQSLVNHNVDRYAHMMLDWIWHQKIPSSGIMRELHDQVQELVRNNKDDKANHWEIEEQVFKNVKEAVPEAIKQTLGIPQTSAPPSGLAALNRIIEFYRDYLPNITEDQNLQNTLECFLTGNCKCLEGNMRCQDTSRGKLISIISLGFQKKRRELHENYFSNQIESIQSESIQPKSIWEESIYKEAEGIWGRGEGNLFKLLNYFNQEKIIEKDLLKWIKRINKESLLALEIKEEYHDLYCLYLQEKAKDYYFIYDPFLKHFYYRGCLEEDLHVDAGECIDQLKNFEKIDWIYFRELIGQSTRSGINAKVYHARRQLWSKTMFEDIVSFTADHYWDKFINKMKDYDVNDFLEKKIQRMYGGKPKNRPFVLTPLFSDAQYRGNIYLSFIEELTSETDNIIFERAVSAGPLIAECIATKFENLFFDEFSRSIENFIFNMEHDNTNVSVDSDLLIPILESIPYLLNVEAAGIIPICENPGQNGTIDSIRCFNAGKGSHLGGGRQCLAWGFLKKQENKLEPWGSLFKTETCECICSRKESESTQPNAFGKCLWDEIYTKGKYLLLGESEARPIIFKIKIDGKGSIKEGLENYLKLSEGKTLDIDIPYDNFDKDNQDRNKTIMLWLLEKEKSKKHEPGNLYCIWFALDLSPSLFNYAKSSINRKLRVVQEMLLKLRNFKKKIADKAQAEEWFNVIRGLAHEMKGTVPPLIQLLENVKNNKISSPREIKNAETCSEYLDFMSCAFSKDSRKDLLPGLGNDFKECFKSLWHKSIMLGIYLSHDSYEDGWADQFYKLSVDPKFEFFPKIPTDLKFPQSGNEKRIAAEVIFMASLSNFFKHFIPFWAIKKRNIVYGKINPIPTEDDLYFISSNSKIIITYRDFTIINTGRYKTGTGSKVGTKEALKVMLTKPYINWEKDGSVDTFSVGKGEEVNYVTKIIFPEKLWE